MSQELVCITCPIGCHLTVETSGGAEGAEIQVSGNRCPRGAVYAREETFSPKRVVTATCRVARPAGAGEGLTAPRRAPVRTTAAFPKERVRELLDLLYATELPLPSRRGDVVIRDALGCGVDVVVTRTVE